MKTALIDLHYLPSLEYFACLKQFDQIVIEKEEHFVKQTYRNRCHILGANAIDRLSIPVIGGNKKIKVKDIVIDHEQKWLHVHWRSISSAYGRAPFYEFYVDFFETVFLKREKFLFDFNFQLMTLCLKFLGMDPIIKFSETFEMSPEKNIIDLRSVIHPKKRFELNNFYQPVVYQQVFGKAFVANLSIIDLLFCEGPNAGASIAKSMEAK